jgi:hypothetical protein
LRKEEIIKNLHKVQREDPLINEISGSIGATLDDFDEKIQDFINQLDIDKATWALSVYEKELDIPTNINKPLDERRSIIKGKLRGSGKVGVSEIEIVAESWVNGDVEVTFDNAINIKFISIFGVPANLDDLKARLSEIAPAHLKINYTFRFTLYNDIKSMNVTYDYIKGKNITYEQLLNGGLN